MNNEQMNNEQIYDQQISPLMDQIIAICQANDIPMIASFSIPTDECPELQCSTLTRKPGEVHPRHHLRAYDALCGRGEVAAFAITTRRVS